MSFLYVFVGGGLGSLFRYIISLLFYSQNFYQALIPNILGCFLIGFAYQTSIIENEALKPLLVIGFLGGFTTFSSYIAFISASESHTLTVALYFLLNNALGVLFYILGSKVFLTDF